MLLQSSKTNLHKLNRGGQRMKIPQHEVEQLARCLLPEIQRFFGSEEGQKELKKWEEEQKKQKSKSGS